MVEEKMRYVWRRTMKVISRIRQINEREEEMTDRKEEKGEMIKILYDSAVHEVNRVVLNA